MNNNIVTQATNKHICEALGCSKYATDEIILDIGKFGRISIFLCKECLPKFTIQGGQSIS